ncbi:MAG TPA: YcaO-like family protein [Acidimicrobiales bacterium]|nr:YcaO-like family protein [Acidimicrobiales bacterium]
MDLLSETSKFDGCSPRGRPPAETLSRLTPYLPEAGVTRVANLTGLDHVGIPVWAAVRPNARSLSVSQGKGIDDDAARASAVMEAVELDHAERCPLPCRIESWAGLAGRVDVADVDGLPLSREGRFLPHRPLPWVEARRLDGGGPVWIPYEVVHANAVLPRVPGSGCFVASTNGLASGNNTAEAVLHGLCEVIERDALALWSAAGSAAGRLDLSTVADPAARRLLDLFEAAGIDVAAWDVTSDVGVPVYRVVIVDRLADDHFDPKPAAFGAGCSPDPDLALRRALTEAAQSRLTTISGARDDLTRARYRGFQDAAGRRALRDSLAGGGATPMRPPAPVTTVEHDVAAVLAALHRAGVGPALVADLSRPGWPVAVVRVVVVGLEGPDESPSYTPGPRARAAAGR